MEYLSHISKRRNRALEGLQRGAQGRNDSKRAAPSIKYTSFGCKQRSFQRQGIRSSRSSSGCLQSLRLEASLGYMRPRLRKRKEKEKKKGENKNEMREREKKSIQHKHHLVLKGLLNEEYRIHSVSLSQPFALSLQL